MIKGFRDFLMRGNVVDLAVAVTVIVTRSAPTLGSLYVAAPLPFALSLIVSTVTRTAAAMPQWKSWPRTLKFLTLLLLTENDTLPRSVGSSAWPTRTYFPLDVPS